MNLEPVEYRFPGRHASSPEIGSPRGAKKLNASDPSVGPGRYQLNPLNLQKRKL